VRVSLRVAPIVSRREERVPLFFGKDERRQTRDHALRCKVRQHSVEFGTSVPSVL